jgi:sec-independent protein translocase protein TatA
VIGDILQPTHLLFVLVVALLVLGPKRLPEVGRSLGRGLRDFRNAVSGEEHHDPTITQSDDEHFAPTGATTISEPAETAAPAAAPKQPSAATPKPTA